MIKAILKSKRTINTKFKVIVALKGRPRGQSRMNIKGHQMHFLSSLVGSLHSCHYYSLSLHVNYRDAFVYMSYLI